MRTSPHWRRWEAARCLDEPEKQIVRIEWDSAEGHLQGFRQSADFKPFLVAAQPFFNDIEDMTHYEVTAKGLDGSSSSDWPVLNTDTQASFGSVGGEVGWRDRGLPWTRVCAGAEPAVDDHRGGVWEHLNRDRNGDRDRRRLELLGRR
jgi:hypothetical protein